MYFAHTWRDFLDRLEEVVRSIPESEKVIFRSHYPMDMLTSVSNTAYSSVSSTGKRVSQLIERPNTIVFVSGHDHPKSPILEHHGAEKSNGQFIEAIGADIKKSPQFEILTVDNGRFVSHKIDADHPNRCIVTYPVPSNQTVMHAFINDENAKLRILCFSEQELKIELHGDLEGEVINEFKLITSEIL